MQSERGFEYGVKHIISPQSGELADVLLSTLTLSPEQTNFLLELGSIYLNGARLREKLWIEKGAYLRVHTKPRRFPGKNLNWPERLLFANDNFAIFNKPSGLPVHASVDNSQENLQCYAEKSLQQKLYVTHRLDVPTSGLILYAKNKAFQSLFNNLMAERKVTKIYQALVEGQLQQQGLLRHYMESSPRAPKVLHVEAFAGGQECLLQILSTRPVAESHSAVRISLLTGRTHQIRAQLAFIGHPILEDQAYGARKTTSEDRISLQASELSFIDPLSGDFFEFKLPSK